VRSWAAIAIGATAATLVLLAIFAPYVGAEYLLRRHGLLIGPVPTQPVRGQWIDDYFLVERIDATTFAIGEPRYYDGNYSYLIVGDARALLFDGGTGNRDIVPVVRSLTALPVTVIPSHLHHDHVGAFGRFERTALPDFASLRSRASGGWLRLHRYEFLGFADSMPVPSIHVDEWWRAGSTIDLGSRRLQLIAVPGHTPTSVALYDADRRQLFAGDFIYPAALYAFLPGSSRRAYLETTRRLLATLDPATRIFAAHLTDDPAVIAAPVLEVGDLRALEAALVKVTAGDAQASGFYPREFPVRGLITLATGFPWNNR
jgi:hydroxyacylglutathione hydrolase